MAGVPHRRKSEADGRKKKMQEGLGVTSVPDHADPQRTEEKALPRGVGGSRPSEGGDDFTIYLYGGAKRFRISRW